LVVSLFLFLPALDERMSDYGNKIFENSNEEFMLWLEMLMKRVHFLTS
jgi:hypothetical protein